MARGGASMVTTHALAYFRMQGLSSMAGYLPICDANALTLELGERALVKVVRDCPLVAGLLCVDPTRDMARFLEKVAAAGYHGVMNCPTVPPELLPKCTMMLSTPASAMARASSGEVQNALVNSPMRDACPSTSTSRAKPSPVSSKSLRNLPSISATVGQFITPW